MKHGGPGEVTEAVVRTVVAPLPWHQRHRWFRVLWRTARVMMGMDTSMHCAGVAYFGFLSLFPAAAAAVLLLGLLARPGLMADIVGTTEGILPEVARQTIANQLVVLLAQPRATLGIGLFISLVLGVWGGSRGFAALIYATTRTHAERARRGFIASIIMSILVTLVAAIALLSVLSLVAVIPAVFAALPWLAQDQAMILLLRWPVLLAFGILTFAAFYRFAPDRRAPPAHVIWPGAIIASVLWLVACAAFSFYVEFAGNLEATFGSLATAIVLLLWMYNSALAVVLGASINAELERDAQGPRTA